VLPRSIPIRRAIVAGTAVAFVAIAAAVVARAATSSQGVRPNGLSAANHCPGSERWAIKTLTDPDADSVDFAHPDTTRVAILAAQDPAPVHITSSTPRLPLEKVVYRVTVRLVKAKIEESGDKGDEDIHLVIADPTPHGEPLGQTMIAEFPKPGCAPESHSIKAPQMAKARAAFVAACGTPPLGKPVTYPPTATATITGVGFFDLKHGTPQLGRAPHDRELHPVLKFVIKTPCH
jgi:hypothetical protein